ncbi:MAG: flagellar protein FlaG [Magnetococcales bacterium]|nr:flagellar protein FlaG [Magnetococcales bacterium]
MVNAMGSGGAAVKLPPDRAEARMQVQRDAKQARAAGEGAVPLKPSDPVRKTQSMELDRASMEKLTEEINQSLNSVTALNFSVDSDANRVVVKVMDRQSNTLIRQIPSEEMMDLAKRMKDLQGAFVNAKA